MKNHTKQIISGILLFILGGIIVPALFFGTIFLFLLTEKPVARFIIPAEIEVIIEKEGRYYLWNDYQTVFENRTYSMSKELPNGLEISLREKTNDNVVEFTEDQSIISSTANSRKIAIGYYEIKQPAKYILSVSGKTEPRVFSLGTSFFNANLFIIALIVFPLEMLMGIGGFVLIVIGIINLVKAGKQNNSAS